MSDWYGFEGEPVEDDADDDCQQQLPIKKSPATGYVPAPVTPPPPAVEEIKELFLNSYRHCGVEWDGTATCACHEQCPVCGEDVNPYDSMEI